MKFRTNKERLIQEINWFDMGMLRPYLLYLKNQELGGLYCEKCSDLGPALDIHHKRYALNVTIDDLQILCGPCHGRKYGKTKVETPTRRFNKKAASM